MGKLNEPLRIGSFTQGILPRGLASHLTQKQESTPFGQLEYVQNCIDKEHNQLWQAQ